MINIRNSILILISCLIFIGCSESKLDLQNRAIYMSSYKKEIWAKYGIYPKDIYGWETIRVNDPKEAQKWIKKGYSHIELRSWLEADISLTDINKWESIGIISAKNAKKWKELKIDTIKKASKWTQLGIYNSFEVEKMFKKGYVTPKSYLNHGGIIEKNKPIKKKLISSNTKSKKNIHKVSRYTWKEIPESRRYWNHAGVFYPDEAKGWVDFGAYSDDAKDWKRAVGSLEEAKKWKPYAHRPYVVSFWKDAGFYTPKEIKKWYDIGFTSRIDIIYWKKLMSLEEAKKWVKIGTGTRKNDIKVFKELFTTPSEAKGWIDAGFNSDKKRILEWKKLFSDPKEAKKFVKKGYKISTIMMYKENNIGTFKEMEKWEKLMGRNTRSFIYWKRLNVTNLNEVKDWLQVMRGNQPYDIEDWRKAGVYNPKEAIEWSELGVNRYSIKEWKESSVNTVEKVKKWLKVPGISNIGSISSFIDNGITPPEATKWAKVGLKSRPGLVKDMKDIKVNPKEFLEWKKLLKKGEYFRLTDAIVSWHEVGVTAPQKVKKWTRINFFDIFYVKDLKKIGITKPKEVKKWYPVKPYYIKKVKEYGLKYTELLKGLAKNDPTFKFFKNKKKLLSIIKTLKSNNCKKMEEISFGFSDSYENKGKCYFFSGILNQRLSRHTGLAQNITIELFRGKKYVPQDFDKYKPVFFVKFKESWKENDEKVGFIKGVGNYRYETIVGTIKNVPSGRVIKAY